MYGIPNCDVVKKAASWLQKYNIPFEFHDYKKEGAPASKLKEWSAQKGWETIFNKRSTTWKDLSAAGTAEAKNSQEAIAIMAANTSIIKRPIIETGDGLLVGFNETEYNHQLIKK
jgi:Spx/MgsR family transcriptional regulator